MASFSETSCGGESRTSRRLESSALSRGGELIDERSRASMHERCPNLFCKGLLSDVVKLCRCQGWRPRRWPQSEGRRHSARPARGRSRCAARRCAARRCAARRCAARRGRPQSRARPSAGGGRGADLRGVAALHAAAPLRVPRVSDGGAAPRVARATARRLPPGPSAGQMAAFWNAVLGKNLQSLLPERWLSDGVINAYIDMLRAQARCDPNYHLLGTHRYVQLSGEGHYHARRRG